MSGVLRAYRIGLRRAVALWPLISALWLASAAFGVTFALAAALWLADALDGALATRTLLRDLDVQVLLDLWTYHRAGLRLLLVVAAVLAVGHTALWWWLDGVVVAAVTGAGAERWRRGAALAPVMAGLFACGLTTWLAWSGVMLGVAMGLLRLGGEAPAPAASDAIVAGTAGVWLLGTAWLVAVHDQARLRAGLTGGGALAAYAWALGFVAVGGERAFGLALLLQISGGAIWAVYQLINLALPLTELIGLTGSLLWGQLFLWLRTGVRVWRLAAQRELH